MIILTMLRAVTRLASMGLFHKRHSNQQPYGETTGHAEGTGRKFLVFAHTIENPRQVCEEGLSRTAALTEDKCEIIVLQGFYHLRGTRCQS